MKSNPMTDSLIRLKFRKKKQNYFSAVVTNKGVQKNFVTSPSKSNMKVNLPYKYKEVFSCMHRLTQTNEHSSFFIEKKITS